MIDLSDKILIMLISPSAGGKSTIAREATKLDDRFHVVRGFTSRQPRADDAPDQFFYLSDDEIALRRNAGQLLTEVTYPTTGQTYGTIAESYQGEYCLLETLSNSVQTYRDLGFGRTCAITIVPPAELWKQRFRDRYPVRSEEATKRLDEARISLHWSLAQVSEHHWLVNDQPPREMAQQLISIATGKADGDDGHQVAEACLDTIQTMWT